MVLSKRCIADLDKDNDVDGNDLATLASDFDRRDCSSASPCAGDINGDGLVDLDDLSILATELGRTDCPHDEYYYFHNDHLGTPQRITDQSGAVVWSANYKPFGQADITIDTITNPFHFPGQYFDPETGLHYNYFRYYDPGIGRYLRGDTVAIVIRMDHFTYLSNTPINGSDPFGLYREVGGGFGLTFLIGSILASIHTEICCDSNKRKHLRTIHTFCVGLDLGLGLKSSYGAGATISDNQKPERCPKMYDKSGWYSEESGVWGALIIGRS